MEIELVVVDSAGKSVDAVTAERAGIGFFAVDPLRGTSPTVVETFLAQQAEVAAGVRQQLEFDARRHPGLRLLPGRFMVIEQAMGLPKGRSAAAAQLLSSFVQEMTHTGWVHAALKFHGIEGAGVAPPR